MKAQILEDWNFQDLEVDGMKINHQMIENFSNSFEAVKNLEFDSKINEAIAVVREYLTAYGKEDFKVLQKFVKDSMNLEFNDNVMDLLDKSVELEMNEGIKFVQNLSLEQIGDIVKEHAGDKLVKELNLDTFYKLNENLAAFTGLDLKDNVVSKVKQSFQQI